MLGPKEKGHLRKECSQQPTLAETITTTLKLGGGVGPGVMQKRARSFSGKLVRGKVANFLPSTASDKTRFPPYHRDSPQRRVPQSATGDVCVPCYSIVLCAKTLAEWCLSFVSMLIWCSRLEQRDFFHTLHFGLSHRAWAQH